VARWLRELSTWVEPRLKQASECPVLVPERLMEHWRAVRTHHDTRAAYLIWRALGLLTWTERYGVTW